MSDEYEPQDRQQPMLGDVTPNPDPTRLTTSQLIRELNSLRLLIEARLSAIDGRIDLLRAHLDRVPSDIKESSREILSATDKSFSSAINSATELRDTQYKALDDKVSEIRDRMTSVERYAGGRKEATTVILIVIIVMVAIWAALVSFIKLA